MIYGYIRVSPKEQNKDSQLIAMDNYNISKGNIFIYKQSGKNFERMNYRKLMRRLKRMKNFKYNITLIYS